MKKSVHMKQMTACLLALFFVIGGLGTEPVHAAAGGTEIARQTMISLNVVTQEQASGGLYKKVTRQQFAKMLVKMSVFKNKVGKTSKTSIYRDVNKKSGYAPYIRIAVNQGWMKGNLSGKFRPKSEVTKGDAANAAVALLGYDKTDFQGNLSSAKWNFYKSEKLNRNVPGKRSDKLTYADAINLFYNVLVAAKKDGTVYAKSLGYELDANGDIDQLALIAKDLKGPYIVSPGWDGKLPFKLSDATVYINGKYKRPWDIKEYDVAYYHKNSKTIYVFREQVTGKLNSVLPNTIAPVSVVVDGKTYNLSGQEVCEALSSAGTIEAGDYVTLLFGKDGTVVGIGKARDMDSVIGGIVIKTGKHVSEKETGSAAIVPYIEVLDTTGNVRQIDTDGKEYYSLRQTVEITYTNNVPTINKVFLRNLSGTVDSKAETFAGYGISSSVHITEYFSNGNYAMLDKTRIAGKSMGYGNVLYYHINSSNEITDMIVSGITGDNFTYGILLSSEEEDGIKDETGKTLAASSYGYYKVLCSGQTTEYHTQGYHLSAGGTTGPVQIGMNETQSAQSLRFMTGFSVKTVSNFEVGNGTKSYRLADDVQVYIKSGTDYYQTSLSKVNNLGTYQLMAYNDNSVDENVRIIIATAR